MKENKALGKPAPKECDGLNPYEICMCAEEHYKQALKEVADELEGLLGYLECYSTPKDLKIYKKSGFKKDYKKLIKKIRETLR